MPHSAALSPGYSLPPSILREYDIRGIVGESLSVEDAYAIGQTFATIVIRETGNLSAKIAVGRDGRLSSPELSEALIKGILQTGAEVLWVGVGPTPMLYFALYHLNAHAGIMVTGSHNPPAHNGFKMMLGRASFFGESVQKLGAMCAAGDWNVGRGSLTETPVFAAYIDTLLDRSLASKGKRLSFALDAGNGAAGEACAALAEKLRLLGHEVVTINAEIDGHFPNHHPDPSVPENMQQLRTLVLREKMDVGLAFDGDGDRLGAVDDKGRILSPDHLLMLLAENVLKDHQGATLIADVKTSQAFFDRANDLGGKAIMWKTGHSHIKAKMKELGAAFAGEASGHIFFADRYFGFDDGLYAALRLIELCAELPSSLSARIDHLPRTHSTPEIRIACDDRRKFEIIEEVKKRLDAKSENYVAIDGVRVNEAGGWWLIRASNTQAVINARCEAEDAESLARLVEKLRSELAASGITLAL